MTTCQTIQTYTDDERRTILLALKYREECYRRGHPYYLFGRIDPDFRDNRYFKTFDTVRRWLTSQHWQISMDDPSWQGYVRFVFDTLHPMIPQPAQLKNSVLLKKYLTQPHRSQVAIQTQQDTERLRNIYRQVVDPEYAAELWDLLSD